jgi:hypothetical protein
MVKSTQDWKEIFLVRRSGLDTAIDLDSHECHLCRKYWPSLLLHSLWGERAQAHANHRKNSASLRMALH